MSKPTPAQQRVLDALKAGGCIRYVGTWPRGHEVLYVSRDADPQPVARKVMGALVQSGRIRLTGSPLDTGAEWIAAEPVS